MGADIKSLRNRMKSVDSTLHLTKAMGLVASSKIRRATEQMNRGREYRKAIGEIVTMLSDCPECRKSPYLQPPSGGPVRRIVIAGDRGLAGGYNANVFRKLAELEEAELLPIGKRACDRLGEGYLSAEGFSYADASELARRLCNEFSDGKFGSLELLGTKYVSMLLQQPYLIRILPFSEERSGEKTSIVFEPDEANILQTAVPGYVAGVIYAAVKESFACEIAARRTAMDAAGKNAQEMIDDLKLAYNRARQATITQEITEIVAGSEA